jgi:hypothetical protein
MLEILNIRDADKIVPTDEDQQPTDPVTENMNVINNKPVKAFAYQDHEAHIQTHQSAMQDPKIMDLVAQSPMADAIGASMAAHIQEHLAFQYRMEIEKELGFELPGPTEPLPEDIEFRISRLAGLAAAQLSGKNQQEQQQAAQQEQMNDPILQMQQKELEIKEMEAQRRMQSEMGRLQLDTQKAAARASLDAQRLRQQLDIEEARLAARIAEGKSSDQIAGLKAGIEIAKEVFDEQ